MKRQHLFISLIVCSVFGTAAAAETTGGIMRDVYDAIAYLLPLSLRDSGATTTWDSELIDSKLDVLTSASSALVAHAEGADAEFRLLARSFDRLVEDTAVSFRQEWPDYATYSLIELTEHCVACHSRLPAESQDVFGQRLMARMNLDKLAPESVALLYVATRQFDAALALLEQELLQPEVDPLAADYRGLMTQYLRTAISTSDDGHLQRVRQFIAKYRHRTDLPYYLDRRLDFWQQATTRLSNSMTGPPDLKRAMETFDHATQLSLAPGDPIRAVDDFVAAREMRAYLQHHRDLSASDRAEIYFRLAIVALRTSESNPSVPEMEILLAAAIQADPRGSRAHEAYALLEEHGYVHEQHLARQLEAREFIDMAALKQLIDAPGQR